jgi:PAS domain S-box-containing protein
MISTIKSIPEWTKEFPSAITICDTRGIIIYMNEKSCMTFTKYGGDNLIGKNLFDCHSEASSAKLKELIETQKSNIYTVEKEGIKKLIYQSPIYDNHEFSGMIEISIELPSIINNFIRS